MKSVFQEARDSFLASLNSQNQDILKSCSSAEELVKKVKAFQAIKRDRIWGKKVFEGIATFEENIRPYFDVVGTLVSSHPEFAAIGWGATLLVLKLASNFATFFENLAKFLEHLAHKLPSYKEVLKIPSVSFSDRLKDSIGVVYTDLFHFFESVTRVFNKASGKPKPSLFVVGGLLWKPFDIRFKELIERFQFHKEAVEHELQITQLKTLGKLVDLERRERHFSEQESKRAEKLKKFTDLGDGAQEEQERKFRDEKLRLVRNWISPPTFARAFEDAKDARKDGTALWLFKEPQYTAWAAWQGVHGSSDKWFQDNALWIRGNPGCGKTIIAAATIEELTPLYSSSPQVYYFFFDSRQADPPSNHDAQRAILVQILHSHRKDHDLIDKFVFAMEHTRHGEPTASRHEIRDLLRVILATNDPVFIIIDAIDECPDPEAMVQDFLLLTGNPVVKTIFFGRPAGSSVVDMGRCMPITQQLNIGKSTSADIRNYLTIEIESMKTRRFISHDVKAASLVDRLVCGADGMFLWARLMIQYLQSLAFDSKQRIRIIEQIASPEKLADMYERILDRIKCGIKEEQILTRDILMWLILSKRPLTSTELKHAIQSSSCSETDEDWNFTVLTLCTGLVEIDSRQKSVPSEATFRLSHSTVAEHCLPLVDGSQESEFWPFPIGDFRQRRTFCEIKVAFETLQFLSYNLPLQPLGGQLSSAASKHDLDEAFPFCSYAASFWIDHVHSTARTQGPSSTMPEQIIIPSGNYEPLLASLRTFLSRKFLLMAWIEASYVCSHPPQYLKLRQWATWASEHLRYVNSIDLGEVTKDLQEFSGDLESLHRDWNSYLSKSPNLIWKEPIAFTPSRFLPQTSGIIVTSLVKDGGGNQQFSRKAISSRYLCKISEVNFDEQLVAVLSVWTSSTFEKFLQQNDYVTPTSRLRDLCSGWHARYEIWSIESSPNRLLDIQIPLNKDSIWLQMKHSAEQRVRRRWRVQFPIAIAPTGRTFAILQHIYTLKSTIRNIDVKLYTFLLPLDFNSTIGVRWSSSYTQPDSLAQSLYLYQVSFSPDGRFISFIDEVGLVNNMAIYEIDSSERFSVGLVNHLKTKRITNLDVSRCKVSFHPELSLLAISTNAEAYLWDFREKKPELRCSSYTEVNPELIKVQRYQDHKFSDGSQIENARDIEFSKEGEMIAIRADGRPEIWPIPNFILMAYNQGSSKGKLPALEGQTPHRSHNAIAALSGPSECRYSNKAIISQGFATSGSIGDGNSQRFATTSTSASAVVLHLWSSSSDTKPNVNCNDTRNTELQLHREGNAELELTKLPNWPEMHTTAASIIWPQSRDDLIRIVLNKTPQSWYVFREEVDQKLPVVIDQDRRLVPGATVGRVENAASDTRLMLTMGNLDTERR